MAILGRGWQVAIALAIAGLVVVLSFGAEAMAQDAGGFAPAVETEVADTTPPVIAYAPDMFVSAVDGAGAIAVYALPAATDDVDGAISTFCAPVSGSLFPVGQTPVFCSATDAAGNYAEIVAFNVVVVDNIAPVLEQPGDIVVTATSNDGAIVSYTHPGTFDAVAGPVSATCAPPAGTLFPVGSTLVTCSASDFSGNAANVSFMVVVEAPIEPTATAVPPEPTEVPETPVTTPVTPDQGSADPSDEGESSEPETTASAEAETTVEVTPTPAALGLPWPPPPPANPIYGSGPVEGLAVIWGGLPFPISQEYGHTLFSLSQETMYQYSADLGLDGRAHPGIDIGMPRGTYLYSPVNGTVVAAGGTGGFGFYGNTLPGVGELRIQTDDGNQVILGHMAAISVAVGEPVAIGQFVGVSGGDNGDHLHLETRHASGGGYIAVDPRQSFLIPILTAYNAEQTESNEDTTAIFEEPVADVVEPGETAGTTPETASGLSDGNGGALPAQEVADARREDDSNGPASVELISTIVDVPAEPIESVKLAAADAVFSRTSSD